MIFDRPTIIELINSVNTFLINDVKHDLQNHLRFKTQIAINVLNIVQRELETGKELSSETLEMINSLLKDIDNPSIDTLAKEIQNGNLDLSDENLKKVLIKLSKNKVSVDNPNYSTYKKLIK